MHYILNWYFGLITQPRDQDGLFIGEFLLTCIIWWKLYLKRFFLFFVDVQWEALALLLIGISVNQLRSLPEGTMAMGLPVTEIAYIYTLIFVSSVRCTSYFFYSCCWFFHYLFKASFQICWKHLHFPMKLPGDRAFPGLSLQWICFEKPIWDKHLPAGDSSILNQIAVLFSECYWLMLL